MVVKIDFNKVVLNLKSVPCAGYSGLMGQIVLTMEDIHLGMFQKFTPKKVEERYQCTVQWIDMSLYSGPGLNHVQVLMSLTPEKTRLSAFLDTLTDLHPSYQDDFTKEFNDVLLFSYSLQEPCPSPPEYGVEIQGRFKKFDIFVREEDLDFIAAFRLEIQERSPPPPFLHLYLASLILPFPLFRC